MAMRQLLRCSVLDSITQHLAAQAQPCCWSSRSGTLLHPIVRTVAHTASREGGFRPETERLVANLFKASLLLISAPLAGGVVLDQLLLPGVVRGLKATEGPAAAQEKAVRNIKAYVWTSSLAGRFATMGGVTALLALLERPLTPATAAALAPAITTLIEHDATLQALIKADAVGKLEHALRSGFIPGGAASDVFNAYLDVHAAQRLRAPSPSGRQQQGQKQQQQQQQLKDPLRWRDVQT